MAIQCFARVTFADEKVGWMRARVYDLTAIDNGQVADLFDLFCPTFLDSSERR